MADPKYIGNSSWRPTGSSVDVSESGAQIVTVEYMGRTDEMAVFYEDYLPGSQCPIAGFRYCYSRKYPTLRQSKSPWATATIVYTGLGRPNKSSSDPDNPLLPGSRPLDRSDPDGGGGGLQVPAESYGSRQKTIELTASGGRKAIVLYYAPFVQVTY